MRLFLFLIIGNILISFGQPTEFNQAALDDIVMDLYGNESNISTILEKHKGKTILIDVWAAWYRDCLILLPKVYELHEKYPDVSFLFLSVDFEATRWKKGIEKFKLGYGDHYLMTKAWGKAPSQGREKSPFCDFIDLNEIPRYMIVNTENSYV